MKDVVQAGTSCPLLAELQTLVKAQCTEPVPLRFVVRSARHTTTSS